MKKFIVSVLIGFLVSVLYLAVMLLVSTPLLAFVNLGVIGARVSVITARLQSGIRLMEGMNMVIFSVQAALVLLACGVFYVFMMSVIKVFLPNDDEAFFRWLYQIVFFLALFVPEIILILSVLIHLPIYLIIGIVVGFTTLMMTFSVIISKKFLTDYDFAEGEDVFLSEETNE